MLALSVLTVLYVKTDGRLKTCKAQKEKIIKDGDLFKAAVMAHTVGPPHFSHPLHQSIANVQQIQENVFFFMIIIMVICSLFNFNSFQSILYPDRFDI